MCIGLSNFDIQINNKENRVQYMPYDNYDLWEERKCVEKFNYSQIELLSKFAVTAKTSVDRI